MSEEKTLEELNEEIEFIEHKGEITEEDLRKAEKKLQELQHIWIHENKHDQKQEEEK
jgi:hypothetical protein